MLQLVAKLLDVAQDAGGQVGPQQEDFNPYYYRLRTSRTTGLVRFVLEDFDKLQEEAYEKAIADARSRAERLARLSQVELGPIVAIREIAVPGEHRPHERPTTTRGRASGWRRRSSRRSRSAWSCWCVSRSSSQGRRKGADREAMNDRSIDRRAIGAAGARLEPPGLPGPLSIGRRRDRRAGAGCAGVRPRPGRAAEKEVLPKHVTPETLRVGDQGAGLPRRPAGRGRLVDQRRRRGVPGGHDRAGRHGLAGPRQLADPRAVLQERAGGRRVPGAVRHAHRADHRPDARTAASRCTATASR